MLTVISSVVYMEFLLRQCFLYYRNCWWSYCHQWIVHVSNYLDFLFRKRWCNYANPGMHMNHNIRWYFFGNHSVLLCSRSCSYIHFWNALTDFVPLLERPPVRFLPMDCSNSTALRINFFFV